MDGLLSFLILLAIAVLPAGASSGSAERVPGVDCPHPHTLRLHRFEDGSARVECGGRALVRVSVPG